MNITFFIGNGFDINLGLQTKYSDFYPFFKENAQDNNMIKAWIDGNEQDWADLEEKLGQELKKVSENTVEQFNRDKDELDELLIKYLDKEQEKYNFDKVEIIKKEFTRSMNSFYQGMTAEDVNSISTTMKKYRGEEYIYSYIIFNYTNVLDKIIALYKSNSTIGNHKGFSGTRNNRIGKAVHIHGTVKKEMILGVNDESQIANEFLKNENNFKDTFIKERMNKGIGQRKTETTIDIIKKSHIVCIFGMSIGNTDKMWWEELIRWLGSSDDNKLVIFWKESEDKLKNRLSSQIIRMNNEIKRKVFERGKGKNDENYFSEIKDRILISHDSDIFSLPKVNENE